MAQAMEMELYVAAMTGDIEFLKADESRSDEYYLSKTSENNNNIIHIAIRHEHIIFIEEALKKFPPRMSSSLITEGNSINNTPVHIAAEVGNADIMSLLYDYYSSSLEDVDDWKAWKQPNNEGDSPIHVALLHHNVKIARFLLDKDPTSALLVNGSKETPLHIAIKQHANVSESEAVMAKLRQLIDKGGAESVIRSASEENMSSMIEFLVKNHSRVTSWADEDGMTPLHRAAALSTPYNLQITMLIIKHWPQSAEVCDASGKSILHLLLNKRTPDYSEARNLLSQREIYALRNHQDKDGNTPLHIAVKNGDTFMLRVLLESSAKTNINNKDGVNAMHLLGQETNIVTLQMPRHRNMTKYESEAADRANIGYLRGRVAQLGIEFLLSKDWDGKNVLHKLMKFRNEIHVDRLEFLEFVQQILELCPMLVSETDQNGNTPIHILVQNVCDINNDNTQQMSELLDIIRRSEETTRIDAEANYIPPWLVQNGDGNTPLHESIIAGNKTVARQLLECNEKSAGLVNKRQETLLHLLARAPIYMHPFDRQDIDKMVKANEKAAELYDEEGLTPILRAFKANNLFTATTLCRLCPKAAKICDLDGQTIWHLLMKHSSSVYFVYVLLQEEALRSHLRIQDITGDTPLHLVIKLRRWEIIRDFLDTWKLEIRRERQGENESRNGHQWLPELLEIENKDGHTPADLIAESISLPRYLEMEFASDYRFKGLRSSWGIPRSQLDTYMNSMNVIAALQTTITFTAAFAVPGGLIEGVGTPILIQSKAFQVFMIFDVIAMCLSMMVLICLLWIMASKNKRESIMIQDFAVSLLLASFLATLLTFMTGVYATINPVKPQIAITTLVLCSLLMLLVYKVIVTKLLLPLANATSKLFGIAFTKLAKLAKLAKRCGSYNM